MNLKFFPALFVSTLLALVGHAQGTAPAATPIATTTTPAPSTAGRIIYSPRLPSATELTNVAAAQGLGVERIDQTSSQITVTYKAADGTLNMVAYQLLPSAATPAPTATTVVTAAPAPTTVIYTQEPDPFYYYDDPFYYPWRGYYSPVSVNLGFGFGYRGYRHGGFHGGWHGHGHGHR